MATRLDTIKLYYGEVKEHRVANYQLDLTGEGVLVATMSNPSKLNSLDGEAVAEFFFITEFAEQEPSVKVVVWTGSGRAFSAGANFAKLKLSKTSSTYAKMEAYTKAGKGLLRNPDIAMKSWLYRMLEFPKLSICAVNGIAIGGGANFALMMHDFVFAAEKEAKFRYPFSELGIVPEMGSSYLFPRLFAKRYVMTGDWFDGRDAEKIGLVYKVVPLEMLMKESLALATRLATSESLQGMMMSKRILNEKVIAQLNQYRVCDIENERIDEALTSDYTRGAIQRFVQKHGSGGSKSGGEPIIVVHSIMSLLGETISTVTAKKLLFVCLEAARVASETIREVHASGQLFCVEKGNGTDAVTGRPMSDIQTEADRMSEQAIVNVLRSYFPSIRIVGEEGTESGDSFLPESTFTDDEVDNPIAGRDKAITIPAYAIETTTDPLVDVSDLIVYVDPLDGTSDFVKNKLHCVSVLIGVAYKGCAFLGVIHRPFETEKFPFKCMYGGPGVGVVYVDNVRLFACGPKNTERLNSLSENPIVMTTTSSKSNRVIERVFELVPNSVVLKEGGAGWKCWLVADGTASAYQYPRPGTKRWDILAGDAIITTLGGAVSDACGNPIDYSLSEATVTNGYVNEWGILASGNKEWHYTTLAPASRRALQEAASDCSFTQWPKGLIVPE